MYTYMHRCVTYVCVCVELCVGADAVLGVMSSSSDCTPREQQIQRMKHSPGSGVLSVSVLPDGPTQIVRVTDQNKKVRRERERERENVPITACVG